MPPSGVETLNDLEQLAARLGLGISREELARWGPRVLVLFGDLDRLARLPIADLEPAFTPARAPTPALGYGGPE